MAPADAFLDSPKGNTHVNRVKSTVGAAATVAAAAGVTVFGLSSPAQAASTEWWRDVGPQKCLDSNTSGNVYTLGCNGGNFQEWTSGSGTSVVLRDYATG